MRIIIQNTCFNNKAPFAGALDLIVLDDSHLLFVQVLLLFVFPVKSGGTALYLAGRALSKAALSKLLNQAALTASLIKAKDKGVNRLALALSNGNCCNVFSHMWVIYYRKGPKNASFGYLRYPVLSLIGKS